MSLEIIRNSDGSFALWSTIIDAYIEDGLEDPFAVGRAAADYFDTKIDLRGKDAKNELPGLGALDEYEATLVRWMIYAKDQSIPREEFESGLVTISVDDLLAASDERSS